MKKKILLVYLVLMVTTITCVGTPNAASTAKPIELKYAIFVPSMHVMGMEAKAWAAEVEKRTNGRVKITLYPGGTLLQPRMVYEGVTAGTTDIGVLPCTYNRGIWPISIGLNYVPERFPSANVGTHVINDLYKKYQSSKEFSTMKILYFFTCDPGATASRKPIRSVEDAKGLEIKGTAPEMFKLLGSSMVDMPMSEAVFGLQKGTIGAAIISYDVLKGMKFADVVKYVSPNLQLGITAFWVGMNLNSWKSLPPDIQKIINEINEERVGIVGQVWDKVSEENIAYAKSVGVEFISWPPEEEAKFKKVLKPCTDNYIAELNAKGLPGKEIMDTIIELTRVNFKKFQK